MGVIYSMMQVGCTMLPDTIVFNSKMNRPNKPEAKGNKNKTVWSNFHDRCHQLWNSFTITLEYHNSHVLSPFLKGTLTQWRHITRKLSWTWAEYVQKMNEGGNQNEQVGAVCIKHNTDRGVISVLLSSQDLLVLFSCRPTCVDSAAHIISAIKWTKRPKGNRNNNQCLYILREMIKSVYQKYPYT